MQVQVKLKNDFESSSYFMNISRNKPDLNIYDCSWQNHTFSLSFSMHHSEANIHIIFKLLGFFKIFCKMHSLKKFICYRIQFHNLKLCNIRWSWFLEFVRFLKTWIRKYKFYEMFSIFEVLISIHILPVRGQYFRCLSYMFFIPLKLRFLMFLQVAV